MSIIIFILRLFIEVCTTIGLCSLIYVFAGQPITSFTIIVWGAVSAIIRIGIKIFDTQKEHKEVKEEQIETEVIENKTEETLNGEL